MSSDPTKPQLRIPSPEEVRELAAQVAFGQERLAEAVRVLVLFAERRFLTEGNYELSEALITARDFLEAMEGGS